jgi:hypothetical protein
MSLVPWFFTESSRSLFFAHPVANAPDRKAWIGCPRLRLQSGLEVKALSVMTISAIEGEV